MERNGGNRRGLEKREKKGRGKDKEGIENGKENIEQRNRKKERK